MVEENFEIRCFEMLQIELILIRLYQHYFTMAEENFEIRCSEMLQIVDFDTFLPFHHG